MAPAAENPKNPLPVFSGRCGHTFDTGMFRIVTQLSTLIVVSHILHRIIFRQISQPTAGMLIGPTMLGKLKTWNEFLYGASKTNALGAVVIGGRMVFMFLIGLEMDIPFLLRSLRRSSIIALGSSTACLFAAVASSTMIYHATEPNGNPFAFMIILGLLFANTSSPMVIRMCAELKLSSSEIGRLAVSSSLLNDMACLLIVSTAITMRYSSYSSQNYSQKLIGASIALLLLVTSAAALKATVRRLNERNKGRRHLPNLEAMCLLSFVMLVACVLEVIGYNSTMASFLLGLVMPRGGGALRTLVDKLSYPANNLILPVFFGFAAMTTDITTIRGDMVWTVVVMVILNIAAKVLGTIAAAWYLGVPLREGIVLGFLLNIKGHVDIVLVSLARGSKIWGEEALKIFLVTVLLATLAAGPAVSVVTRFQHRALRYRCAALHSQPYGAELRLLACVHCSRDLPTMLNLIEICGGGRPASPLNAYLMHLVELTAGTASYVLYHQHDAEEDSGWEHGGDDELVVTAAADVFSLETGIGLRQVTVVSTMETMQEDVYNATVDIRASLVIVPFHKHQRVDGRMQVGKSEVQRLNERVLKRIPCTVGILVDRGLDGGGSGGGHTPVVGPTASQQPPQHHVAVLFFGGADDREALAFGMRLCLHPSVSLTVIHFLPEPTDALDAGLETASSANTDVGELLVPIVSNNFVEREMEADEALVSIFLSRTLPTGRAAYVEKYVRNAAETVTAVCAMNNKMYSLFLVGRGRESASPLTRGMSEWEECPELGSVGDLLASSDFTGSGSVLVTRHYNINSRSKKDDDRDLDEEFRVMRVTLAARAPGARSGLYGPGRTGTGAQS
ncbi:Cation/H(+) antiporter 15 [Platanthera zijinensis]|uniref:Cation/H(+) antiporter 15 n=1 Tax=Platanthera zijinensis TaxID=2320716 RepID=A0AAP0GB87_9ASPA